MARGETETRQTRQGRLKGRVIHRCLRGLIKGDDDLAGRKNPAPSDGGGGGQTWATQIIQTVATMRQLLQQSRLSESDKKPPSAMNNERPLAGRLSIEMSE